MKNLKKIIMLFFVCLLASCGAKETEQLPVYQSLDDLKGKKVAALTGCFQEALLEKEYPEVEVLRIESPADMVQALATRRCEALVMDDYNYLYYMQSVNSLTVLPELLTTGEMGVCFGKGKNVELREAFNAFLKQIKEDGTYDQIYDKWLRHSNEAEMPDIAFAPDAKPIRIGTSAISPPMGYIRDGQIVGFDVEIANRFAASIGRSVQWTDMNFSALIPALVSGTQDMAIAAINITPERAKSIDFSDAYFVSGTAIGLRLENTAEGMKQVNEKTEQLPVYQSLDDLKGKKLAVMTGSFYESTIEQDYPGIEVMRIDNPADLVQALIAKRCDAIILEDYIFLYHTRSMNGLATLKEPLDVGTMGFCFPKGKNVELREKFNEFLAKIKADGTYQEMYDKWLYHPEEAEMPDIEWPEDAEPIHIATASVSPALVFMKDGKLMGFDVELATRFAQYVGRRVVWSDMTFASMIPALISGKQDMIAGAVNITAERAKSIDYGDPYFECASMIVVRSENAAGNEIQNENSSITFFDEVKNSFYRNIIEENRYLMIWSGLKLTALISLFAGLFGTFLGGLVCWLRMCRWAILRRLAGIYISLMRGTPVLVLLMLMFYVVFAGTSIDAVMVAIITFGMNFAAYVSEMFRSSIESVDKGQTEAGIALGFTPIKTFCYIVMPQAFKQVLPVYKGELISLVKMTSIVGYIAVQDLTKVGDIIRSRTFDAFFPLIMVAVLYFLLSWIFASVLDFIAKKTN